MSIIKLLGIIGMGKIGSLIAKRGHLGFDMNILYHNRTRNLEAEKNFNAVYVELDSLLMEADFVCLMTPLTPETENLIGQREFKLMKNSAIFVNGSRGKTVDEKALIEALKRKEIHGAALDVFQSEPVKADHPLLQFLMLSLPRILDHLLTKRNLKWPSLLSRIYLRDSQGNVQKT